MAIDKRIGFMGAGQMAEALARGLINKGVVTPRQITATDPVPARKELFKGLGANPVDTNLEVRGGGDRLPQPGGRQGQCKAASAAAQRQGKQHRDSIQPQQQCSKQQLSACLPSCECIWEGLTRVHSGCYSCSSWSDIRSAMALLPSREPECLAPPAGAASSTSREVGAGRRCRGKLAAAVAAGVDPHPLISWHKARDAACFMCSRSRPATLDDTQFTAYDNHAPHSAVCVVSLTACTASSPLLLPCVSPGRHVQ